MDIEKIQQVYGVSELQKVAGGGKTPEKSEKVAKSDSVTVSKKAKELASSSSATASVEAHIKALPDVRAERVQAAKEKIASGYFNTPEFDNELSELFAKKFLGL